jgi:hypothetical protein
MVRKQWPRAPKSWAYAYQLNPPQPEPRFAKVKMLLRRARLAAQRDGRLWTGQIVMESHITHILVVTDAPDEVRAVDRAIDAELKRLKMGFAITGPARVVLPPVTPGSRAPKRPARSVARSRIP